MWNGGQAAVGMSQLTGYRSRVAAGILRSLTSLQWNSAMRRVSAPPESRQIKLNLPLPERLVLFGLWFRVGSIALVATHQQKRAFEEQQQGDRQQ